MSISGLRQNVIALFGTLRGRISAVADATPLILTVILVVIAVLLGDSPVIWIFNVFQPLSV